MTTEWHREQVGGLWNEIGQLQFELLLERGLKPWHYLLDLGCGSLRGGVHFVRYLDRGRYYGVDPNPALLGAGHVELRRYHLTDREPVLVQMDTSSRLGTLRPRFDFAIAHSVFTHLPPEDIRRGLADLEAVMKPGGVLAATFFEAPAGAKRQAVGQPCLDGSCVYTYPDRDPYHLERGEIERFCEGTGWRMEYVGDWSHPRNQKLVVFTTGRSAEASGPSPKMLLGCVAENNPKFHGQVLSLLRSLRWFGGALATADVMVCVVDEVDGAFARDLERLGALVRVVSRFNPRNPPSNKTQLLLQPEVARYDTVLALDCDTIVVRDPGPFLTHTTVQAKIAPLPTVPQERLAHLCRHFGLGVPDPRYVTTFTHTPTMFYCNSGVIAWPVRFISPVIEICRDFERRLTEEPELLGPHRYHVQQAGLALALVAHPVPTSELPICMNFQLNLPKEDLAVATAFADPVILHHHGRLDEDGFLSSYTAYRRAAARVEQYNRRLGESRAAGSSVSPASRRSGDPPPSRREGPGPVPVPFIIGSGRSGTTLLRMMLDRHPDIAVPPETQFIPEVVAACRAAAQPDETFVERLTGNHRWPDFKVDDDALRRRIATLVPFDVSTALRTFYRLYAERFDKPRWGDQTPVYCEHVELLRDLFPEAHFIHIVRDGRDVALSYRTVWFGHKDVENGARHWMGRVQAARVAGRFDHYLELRYEHLILEPERTLRRVCQFLDLPWDPVMLDYQEWAKQRLAEMYREVRDPDARLLATAEERVASQKMVARAPDPSRIARWRREMSAIEVRRFEAVAGGLLRQLGYEVVTRRSDEEVAPPGADAARPRTLGVGGIDPARGRPGVRALVDEARRRAGMLRGTLRGVRRRLVAVCDRVFPAATARYRRWRDGLRSGGARDERPSLPASLTVRRLPGNPIVAPRASASLGDNINGPSLIRIPDWAPTPLGRYYLYFAHHRGSHIRLAYADALGGPWRIHEPGVLSLAETPGVGHVASPDVWVDTDRREFRLYFHCPVPGEVKQVSFLARSQDGLTFTASPERLGDPYMRVFRWEGHFYAIARLGVLSRSGDGVTGFERGPNPFARHGPAPRVRHPAVMLEGDLLHVFYSRFGDAPESILYSQIRLTGDWTGWMASEPVAILSPETDYEGADLPVGPSAEGMARTRVRQLRDPAVLADETGTFLVYSVAGEQGLAIAELVGWPRAGAVSR